MQNKEVERSRVTLRQAELRALAWVERQSARGLAWGGAFPRSDRAWVKAWMPELAEVWSYRELDLTTLRRFFDVRNVPAPHRSLPDLRSNLDEFAY